jgi:hypothetical protein
VDLFKPAIGNLDDFVASSHLALFEHTKVEPRAVMLTSKAAIRGSSIHMPPRYQVTRSCVTSNSAAPIR